MHRLTVRLAVLSLPFAVVLGPVGVRAHSETASPTLPEEVADDSTAASLDETDSPADSDGDAASIESASDFGADETPKPCTGSGYERWLKERAKAERVLLMQSSQFRLTLPIDESLSDGQTEFVRESMRILTLRLNELDEETLAKETAAIRDDRIDLSLLSELRAVIRQETDADGLADDATVAALEALEQSLLRQAESGEPEPTVDLATIDAGDATVRNSDEAPASIDQPNASGADSATSGNAASINQPSMTDDVATVEPAAKAATPMPAEETVDVASEAEPAPATMKSDDGAAEPDQTAASETAVAATQSSAKSMTSDEATEPTAKKSNEDDEVAAESTEEPASDSKGDSPSMGIAKSASPAEADSAAEVMTNLERTLADLDAAAEEASSTSERLRLEEQRSAIRRRLQAQRRFRDPVSGQNGDVTVKTEADDADSEAASSRSAKSDTSTKAAMAGDRSGRSPQSASADLEDGAKSSEGDAPEGNATATPTDDKTKAAEKPSGPLMPASDAESTTDSAADGNALETMPQTPKTDSEKAVDVKQAAVSPKSDATAKADSSEQMPKASKKGSEPAEQMKESDKEEETPAAKRAKAAEERKRQAKMRQAARERNRARMSAEKAARAKAKAEKAKADKAKANKAEADKATTDKAKADEAKANAKKMGQQPTTTADSESPDSAGDMSDVGEDGKGDKAAEKDSAKEDAKKKDSEIPQPVKSHTSDCECDRCSAARAYREKQSSGEKPEGKADESESDSKD